MVLRMKRGLQFPVQKQKVDALRVGIKGSTSETKKNGLHSRIRA